MDKNVTINGSLVPVEIIRSKRKTVCLQIAHDGHIIVRAPLRTSYSKIEDFINKKSSILGKHIQKVLNDNKKLESEKPFTPDEIREMAEKALQIIPERVRYYAPIIGVTYGKITIRNQKSKWGSCSGKGNLNFNCLLVMTPPEVLDSVVVHELCHRKQMNHSKAFYAEIYRVFPEYDKWNKWLKENGNLLIRRMTGL